MHVNISSTITARGFTTTAALKDYVSRRLNFAFDRFAARILRVQVRLSDINGPRGGSDKRCQLVIAMGDLPAIVVEDTSSDLYMAIDRSIGRAVHTVGRNVVRRRQWVRPRGPSARAQSANGHLDSADDALLARTG